MDDGTAGVGTLRGMLLVARMINQIDNRLFILVWFLLTAASLWEMTGFSLYMRRGRSCSCPGFRAALYLFAAHNLLMLSGLAHHILTQETVIRAPMCMLGGSIGIAILETELSQSTQRFASD